jgi:peptidoglycan/LPS O-acetylase OafA/YrhL
MAAGQWLLARKREWVQRPLPRQTSPLAWLGRWSLTWYMLHQPVMIGVVAGITALLA